MTDNDRVAKLNRTSGGEVLGASVFLDRDELSALGVDIDGADGLTYAVRDGEFVLAPSGKKALKA